MKRIGCWLASVALAVICVCALVACGSDVVGTYKFYSVREDGRTYGIGDVFEGEILTVDYITLVFNSDGTVDATGRSGGEEESKKGTWKLNGEDKKKVGITIDGDTKIATLSGDMLVIWDDSEIVTLKLDSGAPVNPDFDSIDGPGLKPDPIPEPTPVDPEKVVGTYQFYSVSENGVKYEIGDMFEGEILTEDTITLVLNSDGTGVLTEKETDKTTVEKFTWKVNGNDKTKIEIWIDGEIEIATISGDTLVLWDDSEVITLKLDPNAPVNPNPDPTPDCEKVAGTYQFYSVSENGRTYGIGDMFEGQILSADYIMLVLNSDGTGVLTEKETDKTTVEKFTWKVNGNDKTKIEIWIDGEIEIATISGDTLVLWDDSEIITLKLDSGVPVTPKPTPEPPSDREKIVGTYQFNSLSLNGQTYGIGDRLFTFVLSENFATLVLNSDGTGIATVIMGGETTVEKFTWTFEKNVSATGEVTFLLEAKLSDGSTVNAVLEGNEIKVNLDATTTATLKK